MDFFIPAGLGIFDAFILILQKAYVTIEYILYHKKEKTVVKKILCLLVSFAMIISSITVFASGEVSAVEIGSAEDLLKIREDLEGAYILTSDIDLSKEYLDWNPFGTFYGTFDGNGHKITGLNIKRNNDNIESNGLKLGLFNSIEGAVVSNLVIEGSIDVSVLMGDDLSISTYAGLLAGRSKSSIITNVTVNGIITVDIESTNNSSTAWAGLLVGDTREDNIANCNAVGDVSANVTAGASNANITIGALTGYSDSTVNSCTAIGNVTGLLESTTSVEDRSNVGGLIGSNAFDVKNASTNVIVKSTVNSAAAILYNDAGGVAGSNYGTINGSNVTGNIDVTTVSTSELTRGEIRTAAGGITASSSKPVADNYSSADITVDASTVGYNHNVQVGGMVGYLSQQITGIGMSGCCAEGSVIVNASSKDGNVQSNVGGLVGVDYAPIKGSNAKGGVEAVSVSENGNVDNTVGGLAGLQAQNGNIEGCYATGDVKSEAITKGEGYSFSGVGGLLGRGNTGKISQSYATGDVTSVADTKASANATRTHSCAGGFVGYNNITIENCYAHGNVTSISNSATKNTYNNAGGFVADNASGTISKCYSTGVPTATVNSTANYDNNVNGFAGYSGGTLEYCYFDKDTSDKEDSRVTELTTQAMKVKESFAGFDFDNVWSIDSESNNGYPYLLENNPAKKHPYTLTTVSTDKKSFTVVPSKAPIGVTVVLALYLNGGMVEFKNAVYNGEEVVFTTDKEYDTAKVFMVTDLITLQPVSAVENVK